MRTREIRWLFSPYGGAAQLAPNGWKTFESLARNKNQIFADQGEDARSWQRWEFHASSVADRRGSQPLVLESRRRNDDDIPAPQKPPQPSPTSTTTPQKNDEKGDEKSNASYLARLEADSKTKMRAFRTNAGSQPLLTCHYSVHRGFLDDLTNVLRQENVDKIRHIPAIAVQGGADVICPPTTAFELKEAWPELELRLCPGAGHSQYDPDIKHELLQATDAIARKLASEQPPP